MCGVSGYVLRMCVYHFFLFGMSDIYLWLGHEQTDGCKSLQQKNTLIRIMPHHSSAATLMQENNRGGPAAVGTVMTLFRLPSGCFSEPERPQESTLPNMNSPRSTTTPPVPYKNRTVTMLQRGTTIPSPRYCDRGHHGSANKALKVLRWSLQCIDDRREDEDIAGGGPEGPYPRVEHKGNG